MVLMLYISSLAGKSHFHFKKKKKKLKKNVKMPFSRFVLIFNPRFLCKKKEKKKKRKKKTQTGLSKLSWSHFCEETRNIKIYHWQDTGLFFLKYGDLKA